MPVQVIMKEISDQTTVRRLLQILCLFVLLPASSVVPRGHARSLDTKRNASAGAGAASDQRRHTGHRRVDSANKFDCLPKDVKLEDVVSYARKLNQNVTVEKKLIEMKARCRNGKLVDDRNKEIRFFRVQCWGNPPPNYLEIQGRQREELEKLKKSYTVVVFACNPMIP